jgi:hypothetical protein
LGSANRPGDPSHSLAFSQGAFDLLAFLPALNQSILYELGGNMSTTGAIGCGTGNGAGTGMFVVMFL